MTQPKSTEEKKYSMKMICKNCNSYFVLDFLVGVTCEGEFECVHCGCRLAVARSRVKTTKELLHEFGF